MTSKGRKNHYSILLLGLTLCPCHGCQHFFIWTMDGSWQRLKMQWGTCSTSTNTSTNTYQYVPVVLDDHDHDPGYQMKIPTVWTREIVRGSLWNSPSTFLSWYWYLILDIGMAWIESAFSWKIWLSCIQMLCTCGKRESRAVLYTKLTKLSHIPVAGSFSQSRNLTCSTLWCCSFLPSSISISIAIAIASGFHNAMQCTAMHHYLPFYHGVLLVLVSAFFFPLHGFWNLRVAMIAKRSNANEPAAASWFGSKHLKLKNMKWMRMDLRKFVQYVYWYYFWKQLHVRVGTMATKWK